MFTNRIVITPVGSGAVERLEFDSDTQSLYVTYKSGDNVYLIEQVGWDDFMDLLDSAHDHGSWGRALHRWKVGRVVTFEERDREAFEALVEGMHPNTVARMAEWFVEIAG